MTESLWILSGDFNLGVVCMVMCGTLCQNLSFICGLVRVDRQSAGRWALRVEDIIDGKGGEILTSIDVRF